MGLYRSCLTKAEVEKYKKESREVNDFSNHAFSFDDKLVEKAMVNPAHKNKISEAVKNGGREL